MPSSVVLINVFSVAKEHESEFVKMWTEALEFIKNEPGFIEAKFHKSLDSNAQFPFINVAHWDSQETWKAAFDKLQVQEFTKQVPFEQIPALYTEVVVYVRQE